MRPGISLIKKRMRKIDEELEKEKESNDQRRTHRKRKGFHLVSLAGYTNAGKSSLMESLTEEKVLIEDRMFSTLSTTTKKLKGTSLPILITDTIGFLHNLPPFIIEAFKNTINEIFNADLILLVIDASDEWAELERKLSTSEAVGKLFTSSAWNFTSRPAGPSTSRVTPSGVLQTNPPSRCFVATR